MRIVLPYPYPALWPNKRPHWSAKAKATRDYRALARMLTHGAKPGPVHVIICPKPFGPYPDDDNAKSAFKAARDGIADAMGINDRHLAVTFEFGNRCKDGAVIVEIGNAAD